MVFDNKKQAAEQSAACSFSYNYISRYLRVRKSSPAHLQDPFLFSVLARKEKRFLHSKEKRAPMRVTFPQEAAAYPQLSDCRGAIVERAVAPVSARSRFAWRYMLQAERIPSHAPRALCHGAASGDNLRTGSAASVSEASARTAS